MPKTLEDLREGFKQRVRGMFIKHSGGGGMEGLIWKDLENELEPLLRSVWAAALEYGASSLPKNIAEEDCQIMHGTPDPDDKDVLDFVYCNERNTALDSCRSILLAEAEKANIEKSSWLCGKCEGMNLPDHFRTCEKRVNKEV